MLYTQDLGARSPKNQGRIAGGEGAEAGLELLYRYAVLRPSLLGQYRSAKRRERLARAVAVRLAEIVVAVDEMAGKPEAAEPLAGRLLEVDPLTGHTYIALAATIAVEGRFEEAVVAHERGQEIDRSPPPRVMYAIALARAGKRDAAHVVIDALAREEPGVFASQFGLFIQAALRGHRDRAFAMVTPHVERAARRVEYLSWHMGASYALLGETARAIAWLDHAVDWGFMSYPFLMADPLLERIRGTSEFSALAERTKRAWEAFEM